MSKINGENLIKIPIDSIKLEGGLVVPKGAQGLVIFVHGSGSSRFSPRNRYVAAVLQKAGLATFLFDLLTAKEEQVDLITRELRFDIEMLAERLIKVTIWLMKNDDTKNLKIGYFGSSTGAAAALIAASHYQKEVKAVVSRGGRPDLAISHLGRVHAPTLFIVGGDDLAVIDMNKEALKHLHAENKLEIVAGATHLFEEPGKLEEVANLAVQWFKNHLEI